MNQLVFIENDQVLTDSLMVAETFGKRHADVLRDINYLECSKDFRLRNFAQSSYTNLQNKDMPKFLITQDGFTLLAMGYTGKKAMEFKEAYIKAFREMEKKLKPQSIEDLIIMQAQSMKEVRKELEQTKQEVIIAKHRLDNIDKIDTLGDLQQRLNAMVRRYANQEGMQFGKAWNEFKSAYNTAYHTNLKYLMDNYKTRHGIKSITTPQYLSLTNSLEDGIRVAD